MAQALIRGLLLLACSLSALAQGRDPTLPPKGYYVPPAGQVAGELADGEEAPPPRALQIVVRPHAARPFAVIDGQAVALGARYDDKRLVRVEETEIVLSGQSGREILAMTPSVVKMPVVLADARSKRGEGR